MQRRKRERRELIEDNRMGITSEEGKGKWWMRELMMKREKENEREREHKSARINNRERNCVA